MSEISKAYEPQAVEEKWYQFWLDQNCFTADPARVSATRPAYSIVIPPPNVTGVLTMGHVLNNTIQDILSRKARMDGKEVLWLPGTDHAGIATQTVVERTLKKQGEIKHRNDLGREKFLEKVWEWKEKHGGIIIQQLKKLGASCDWTRERFTMDPEYSACVTRVFVDLYKKGFIYRGKRMVNWCPASLTALSDEEVVMKEQKGFLCYFKVEVAEDPTVFLTIATTRPETIPGDTAVAVNPKDPRYSHLIGKHVVRPLPHELPLEQKLIPIIGDEHVDFEFGTGVLKVTPAHDKADFEIGQRHKLRVVEVIDATGVMNELAGADLRGQDRFKARKLAAEKLKELGSLEKEEPYTNNVGYSERADVPIEPRLSEQWFLKYPSVPASRDCVQQPGDAVDVNKMRFHPDRWAKVYDHWMGGIQDWCISRQLWWGHRIPVWYRGSEIYCGVEAPAGGGWTQDPDVLDTWFSSWLWPFATMGWTSDAARDKANPTLAMFYPTTDLVTGPDIIFFWVARMIMAGYEYMGDLPFRNVYFTGIIRDKQGRKMSKSLGNSPDPLDLIAKYGADALRFGVMRSAPLGQDILFDEQAVELGRNFCNKLWNACRFRQMVGGAETMEGEINPALLTSDDKWILLRLDQAIREVTRAFADYKFSDATATLYRFFWSEYCDWYIEATKAVINGADAARKANTLAVIDFVLGNLLRLFHPFLPFITEELWHGMGFAGDLPENRGGRTIMFAAWPKALSDEEKLFFGLDDAADQLAAAKYELVGLGRNLRREFNIPANKKIDFIIRSSSSSSSEELDEIELSTTESLLNASSLTSKSSSYSPPSGTPTVANSFGELFLPLAGLVDAAAERARLTKELEKIRAEIQKVEQKLANPNFTEKVPATVLMEHKQRLLDWQGKEKQVLAALENLPE
ncbi:MAG TPA: valine--tRNA ligase [Verrucomicrobiae bacterium]|nr:valine--tRNA ligase [Verrucomicrobiae bacterium]